MLNVNWFGFLPSGVGNNKLLLTACIWVFLLEDRDVNQVVGSDVFVHPFDGASKNFLPLHAFVIENLDVIGSVGRCSRACEPCGLDVSLPNVLCSMCQAQDVMALAEALKFVEQCFPGSLRVKNLEVNSVEWGVRSVFLAVLAVNNHDNVVTVLASVF